MPSSPNQAYVSSMMRGTALLVRAANFRLTICSELSLGSYLSVFSGQFSVVSFQLSVVKLSVVSCKGGAYMLLTYYESLLFLLSRLRIALA